MKHDFQTNTVDGAEAYERGRSRYENDDLPTNDELARDEYCEDGEEYYEDECNCSDPGCPCGGYKVGGV